MVRRGVGRRTFGPLLSTAEDRALSRSLEAARYLSKTSGFWAGWEASFSAITGEAKPIDSAYVSEDLREWGQVPLGWEYLASEQASPSSPQSWDMHTYRVLPESGCAADNLAVTQSRRVVDLTQANLRTWTWNRTAGQRSSSLHVLDSLRFPSGEVGIDASAIAPFIECRTVFLGDAQGDWPGHGRALLAGRGGAPLGGSKRVYVHFKFDPSVANIASSTIQVAVGRRLDEQGSSGEATTVEALLRFQQRPTAGSSRMGIDAGTLSSLVGTKPFCDVPRDGAGAVEHAGQVTSIALAGGIVVRYGLLGGESALQKDRGVEGTGPCDSWSEGSARRRDPLAHSFVEVALEADPLALCASGDAQEADNDEARCPALTVVRREFLQDGSPIYEEAAFRGGLLEGMSTAVQ